MDPGTQTTSRYPNTSFDFLGYSFRARRSKNRGEKFFVNFSPGLSDTATQVIRAEIRDWQLRRRIDKYIHVRICERLGVRFLRATRPICRCRNLQRRMC